MGVYGIDSLLQPVSSGQSMNCSLSQFCVWFKRETGRLPLRENTPGSETNASSESKCLKLRHENDENEQMFGS